MSQFCKRSGFVEKLIISNNNMYTTAICIHFYSAILCKCSNPKAIHPLDDLKLTDGDVNCSVFPILAHDDFIWTKYSAVTSFRCCLSGKLPV